jgi:NhaA family Na+:H+ antiporter
MAVFFLLVALELKREMLEGQFSDRSQVVLPAACAVGGMAVPMAIYALVNAGDPAALHGVAIPAATDIAFALGILSLFGGRVPLGLKLLLTAIAVLDDLGAIVLIAFFYTDGLSWSALVVAAIALAGLVVLNLRGIVSMVPFALLGAVMWLAVLESGVHATLAGVALGLTIPLRDRRMPEHSPLERLEHDLHPTVAFAILPLFAFANAGVPLDGLTWSSLVAPVPSGIALGLLVGKPAGVLAAAALLAKLGWARLPDGVNWPEMTGMAALCGIGFTMSLFVGSLAFESSQVDFMIANRIGILTGSLASAALGSALLARFLPRAGAS